MPTELHIEKAVDLGSGLKTTDKHGPVGSSEFSKLPQLVHERAGEGREQKSFVLFHIFISSCNNWTFSKITPVPSSSDDLYWCSRICMDCISRDSSFETLEKFLRI